MNSHGNRSDGNGRQLSRDTVQFTGKDLFFSIQLDVVVKGNDKAIKIKLVPLPDPRINPAALQATMPGFPGGMPVTTPGGYPTRPLPGGLNPVPSPAGPIVFPGLPSNPTTPRPYLPK